MRQNSLGLGLILSILVVSGTAILAVSFQLKEKGLSDHANVSANSVTTENPKDNKLVERFPPAFVSTQVNPSINGVIGTNEYRHHFWEETVGMNLYWTIDELKGMIFIALRSPSAGCVGISLGPSGRLMKGGDVLSGFIDIDGTLRFRDDYAKEETIHTADAELAIEPADNTSISTATERYGKDDIISKSGSSSPQSTTIEFSRLLNTGDTAFDKAIEPVFMRIQLAYSESPGFNCFESQHIITKQFNFFTGEWKDEPQS